MRWSSNLGICLPIDCEIPLWSALKTSDVMEERQVQLIDFLQRD